MCLLVSCTGLSPYIASFPKTVPLSKNNHVCSPQPHRTSTMVWPLTRSLAATKVISFDFSSCRYLDVSVHDVSPPSVMDWLRDDRGSLCRVSPFGHPRIVDCMHLPVAFRSFLRPSSAPSAKAFSHCSYSLDLIFMPLMMSSIS